LVFGWVRGSGLGYDVYEDVSFAGFFEVKRRSVDLDS
jgi:hypothetical protein